MTDRLERAESTVGPPQEMENNDESRRDALGRIGKFAAYTAPAMMVLLTADKAMANSSHTHDGPRRRKKRRRRRW